MIISSNTWHYRIFEWNLNQKYGYIPYQIKEHGSNLCPYVRTVALWAPLRFFFNTTWYRLTGTLLAILAGITELIYKFKGLKGLRIELQVILTVVFGVAIIAGCVGFVWLLSKLGKYLREREMSRWAYLLQLYPSLRF